MSTSQSRISSEVDFEQDGKQRGFLRLPHSVHRSAYGWLPVPIVCIKNGDGPSVLCMSGNHGDEYEGQLALCGLIQELELAQIRGRVIILPMANYPAARAGLRTSPIDDGNLNRSFPGDPDGSPTPMLAHYIEHVLMPLCGLFIDIHSGGSSLMYIPSTQVSLQDDGTLPSRARELVTAFGAPIIQVYSAGGEDRMAGAAAARQGLLAFSTELGGTGMVSPKALTVARYGLPRVLHAFGVLTELPADVPPVIPGRFTEVKNDIHYCYSPEDGVFEPLVELGDEVVAGQPAARIHFPETPWRAPVETCFDGAGLVVCKRVPARTERGDCLFHLASDWPA